MKINKIRKACSFEPKKTSLFLCNIVARTIERVISPDNICGCAKLQVHPVATVIKVTLGPLNKYQGYAVSKFFWLKAAAYTTSFIIIFIFRRFNISVQMGGSRLWEQMVQQHMVAKC
ncbi:hypothetical protein DPMN_090086 [Dreissena polymorpha]|uniref:Uncharacterized protein n=1 Tax=Dreissena polymorpha TaxID=45954 RepID=A0A9D4QZH2_DREPO|nr:hypothetical protein DPMN_090086 [Dreissena polymorpha]